MRDLGKIIHEFLGLAPTGAVGSRLVDVQRFALLRSPHVGEFGGFSIHAVVTVNADDRDGRERLLRYCARPALSMERISETGEGLIAYRLRHVLFNCPEDDIKVEPITSDRYRVSGCEPVIYQCISGTCMPVREDTAASDGVSASDRSASPREDKSQSAKAAVEKSPSGQNLVKVGIPLGKATYLKLSSVPTSNDGAVQFVLIRQEEEPDLQNCDLGMMINGQRIATPATKKARNDSLTMLVLNLPHTTAQELGLARQLSLRACDDRWTLSAEQLTKIHDFTSLYEEELAVLGHPLAKRLFGNLQAVAFQKLLPGQGRPKVSVAGSHEPEDALSVRLSHAMVARSATPT